MRNERFISLQSCKNSCPSTTTQIMRDMLLRTLEESASGVDPQGMIDYITAVIDKKNKQAARWKGQADNFEPMSSKRCICQQMQGMCQDEVDFMLRLLEDWKRELAKAQKAQETEEE